jgi:sialidase-1
MLATNLVDSVCQASMLRLRDGKILFANPASTKRENLTIRASFDDANSWPISKVLHSGPSAYSGLAELSDGTILCVYECGQKSPCQTITLARVSPTAFDKK